MNNKILIFTFLVSAFFVSCSEADYLTYNTSETTGILIASGGEKDSIHVEFGFEPGETFMVKVPLAIIGITSDKDRTYDFTINQEKTSMKKDLHYTINASKTIKAQQSNDIIFIEIQRYKDSEFKDSIFNMVLDLKQSNDFIPSIRKSIKISVDTHHASKPGWWYNSKMGPYNYKQAVKFYEFFHKMEYQNKFVYDLIVKSYGNWLEKGGYYVLNGSYEVPFIKYVLTPLYNYYKQNPDPNVNMPDPSE